MSVHTIHIIRTSDGMVVEAELDDDLSPGTLLDIEGDWEADRQELRNALTNAGVAEEDRPGSLHWDWADKSWRLSLSPRRATFRLFGVRCGGVWQGTMLTGFDTLHLACLPPDVGKPLIYLYFVETAPWNWDVEEVKQTKKHKLIGRALFAAAVAQSYAVGFEGRVALHSLEQAEDFYYGCHMVPVTGQEKNGMKYFELTAEAAAKRFRGR